MLYKVAEKQITYDGRQLRSLWGFTNFGVQGDSIIAFTGPCDVKLSEMVDQADVLEGAFIYSEEMLHFIIEHFDMDLEKTVTRQRLLIAIIKDEIAQLIHPQQLRRSGDDLYCGERKLSVSIATLSPVSSLIHVGLNISSNNTPVQTIGLNDLGVDPFSLAERVCKQYCAEIESIKMARCKVRGVV